MGIFRRVHVIYRRWSVEEILGSCGCCNGDHTQHRPTTPTLRTRLQTIGPRYTCGLRRSQVVFAWRRSILEKDRSFVAQNGWTTKTGFVHIWPRRPKWPMSQFQVCASTKEVKSLLPGSEVPSIPYPFDSIQDLRKSSCPILEDTHAYPLLNPVSSSLALYGRMSSMYHSSPSLHPQTICWVSS